MEVISSQNQAKKITKSYNNIVLVPTMGNLHQGHLSLLDKAREVGKTIITSIYVNPLPVSYTHLTLPTIYSV